jgi:hypothetical protein
MFIVNPELVCAVRSFTVNVRSPLPSRRGQPDRDRRIRGGGADSGGGPVLLSSSALWLDWPVSGLGIWLIAVAAGGAFAGSVGVWAVGALAGGLAFLLMAAIEPALRRA